MSSIETCRAALIALPAADWEPYLLAHANLPGPRGGLELAAAAADLGDEAQFRGWAALGPDVAPENTPGCFLACCGVVGLGAVMARRGDPPVVAPSAAVTPNGAGTEATPLRLLRALAYCWSVAVAALPDAGKPLMEVWLASDDPDIRWIMRENLKKNRLVKMDAAWVAEQTRR